MSRKLVLIITLIVVLVGTLGVAFNVQRVKASGTIYIRANGLIEGTDKITSANNITYTFTDNINDSIVVERDNIVVDGASYIVDGIESIVTMNKGIDLSDRRNVTIKNVSVRRFFQGIYLYWSSNNTLSGNNITANSYGVMLIDSANNTIFGNDIAYNEWGIRIYWSPNNILENNNATNNEYNLAVYGGILSHYIQDIDDSNTVNGRPVHYLVNKQDVSVPFDIGYIALVNCTRITLNDISPANNGQGILLAYTSNSTITGIKVANNWDGIYLHNSINNTISGNNITANSYAGIFLDDFSSDNIISRNNITESKNGIYLINHSGHNNISENDITAAHWYGIHIGLSDYNTIYANKATRNKDGIYLHYAHNNLLNRNVIERNTQSGIYLWSSGSNTLTANNLTENLLNFVVNSEYLSDFYQNIDSSNLINEKPIYYLMDLEHIVLTSRDYPSIGCLALINGNNVTIENINLLDAGGVELAYSRNCAVKNVNVTNCARASFGIWLPNSNDNMLSNITVNNSNFGIFFDDSMNNTAFGNTLEGNEYGIVSFNSYDNMIYHNNFVDNAQHVYDSSPYNPSVNFWDNGFEGNYWSNYTGVDLNHDGIGETPHIIDANNNDSYPLMGMFSSFNTSLGKHVNVVSNSTIEAFEYFESNSTIKMYVSGEGGFGFCRVSIPHVLMNVSSISVIIDDGLTPVLHQNYTLYDNGTHSWIYFAYQQSIHKIDIIPEFPHTLILPLFMIATLLATIVYRRKHPM